MRKILTFPRSGVAALKKAVRSTKLFAVGAGLAVTLCLSGAANAQTFAQQLIPTSSTMSQAPVSTAVAQGLNDLPTVDASYNSILSDTSEVQPAQYTSGGRYPLGNPCNPGCDISWYFSYEAVWFRREGDERFTSSFGNFMPDFEYEFSGRYTAGRLLDCTNAYEVIYVGPFDWQRQSSVFSGGGALQSTLVPSGGYTAAQLTAFNNATTHTQAFRSQLNSFEANRKWVVWDVVSTLIGFRYVDYEEDYLFLSQSAVGTGQFSESIDNQMFGGQIGAEVLYPVSLRANVGFRAKGGVYANFAERVTGLNNAGAVILNAGDTDVDVAGLIEIGYFGTYQIVPSVRITGGYDFWYMPGMATVADQNPRSITPLSGTVVSQDDDVIIHGASIGAQILF